MGVAVVLGPLAVVVAGVSLRWLRPDRLTPENCSHIKLRVSRAEVRTTIGPPGDYPEGPFARPDCYLPGDVNQRFGGFEAGLWVTLPDPTGSGEVTKIPISKRSSPRVTTACGRSLPTNGNA
jgi:hypothetical protein